MNKELNLYLKEQATIRDLKYFLDQVPSSYYGFPINSCADGCYESSYGFSITGNGALWVLGHLNKDEQKEAQ